MTNTIPTKTLRRALALADVGVATDPRALVVTQTYRLKGGRVGAYDFTTSSRVEHPDLEHLPAVSIPARPLRAAMRHMTGDAVRLEVVGDHVELTNASGGLHLTIRLPLIAADNLPTWPTYRTEVRHRLDRAELEQLGRVLFAAGKDLTLPTLLDILVEHHNGRLVAVATDRYRLAIADIKAVPAEQPARWSVRMNAGLVRRWSALTKPDAAAVDLHAGIIVPSPAALADRSASDPDPAAQDVLMMSTTWDLDRGSWSVGWRPENHGAYPNVYALIPGGANAPDPKHTIETSRTDLRTIARTFVDLRGKITSLCPTGDRLAVELKGPDGSLVATADLPATVTPGCPDIHVDGRFLADALAACTGSTARLLITSSTRPLLIAGDDAGLTNLLMPINVHG